MSEVKRYMESCGEGGSVVENRYGDFVSFVDFDRVTNSRWRWISICRCSAK